MTEGSLASLKTFGIDAQARATVTTEQKKESDACVWTAQSSGEQTGAHLELRHHKQRSAEEDARGCFWNNDAEYTFNDRQEKTPPSF